MNAALDQALRQTAEQLHNSITDDTSDADARVIRDSAELIRTLARMAAGKTLYQAFGAPGDWGYHAPIGKALVLAYRELAA